MINKMVFKTQDQKNGLQNLKPESKERFSGEIDAVKETLMY